MLILPPLSIVLLACDNTRRAFLRATVPAACGSILLTGGPTTLTKEIIANAQDDVGAPS